MFIPYVDGQWQKSINVSARTSLSITAVETVQYNDSYMFSV